MMKSNKKKSKQNENTSLHPLDKDVQTYGCRHSNPDICGKHSLEGICAYVNDNNICYAPPASWKKQYKKLSTELKKKNDSE